MAAKSLRKQIAALEQEAEREHVLSGKMHDGAMMMLAASLAPRFALVCDQIAAEDAMGSSGAAISQNCGEAKGVTEIAGEFARKAMRLEQLFADLAARAATRRRDLDEPLRRQLRVIEDGRLLTLDDLGYCGMPRASGVPARAAGWRPVHWLHNRAEDVARRIYTRLFGSAPRTRPRHPLHFMFKDVVPVLDRAAAAGSQILIVGQKDGIAARWTDPAGRQHLRVSPAAVLIGALDPGKISLRFDLCVIELDAETISRIRELRRALAAVLDPGGRILMYWINHRFEDHDQLQPAFAECALVLREGASVRFFSSASGWGTLRTLQIGRGKTRLRRFAGSALRLLARFVRIGRPPPLEGQTPERNCWGTIIEIGPGDRAGAPSRALSPNPEIACPMTAELGTTP
jgi:hypothetical protein